MATETIAISEFKATCLAVLERVRRTGASIIITRRGEPVAEIIPPAAARAEGDWLGSMRGSAEIVGDLVEPVADADVWDVYRA
jgi:prevent-host-death family protein